MSETIGLEQVEGLAFRLSPNEQLKLVAHISEQLSGQMSATGRSDSASTPRDGAAVADALLAELDAIAEHIEGSFDSAEDIRQIRAERAGLR
jgi:hypothetical protein